MGGDAATSNNQVESGPKNNQDEAPADVEMEVAVKPDSPSKQKLGSKEVPSSFLED